MLALIRSGGATASMFRCLPPVACCCKVGAAVAAGYERSSGSRRIAGTAQLSKMTHRRRSAITDDDGEHMLAVCVEPDANGFEGADLCGLCPVATLKVLISPAAALQDAGLAGANLRDAKFGRDNLGSSTRLQGADLTGAQLHGADLRGAPCDDRTKFPVGFDTHTAGCIRVATSRRPLAAHPARAGAAATAAESGH